MPGAVSAAVRRRLDTELVRRGLAPSRTRAAELVREGRITVGGAPALTPARRVAPDEALAVAGPARRFVGRGGEKLDGVLDRLGVAVAGRRALDVGSSTGGFTDCLLQRGARSVHAVDVGTNQLAWALRADPRVVVLERTDVRDVPAPDEPWSLVTVDVSFVPVGRVAPALARLAGPGADLVILVKPQFEAGPARVGRGGIVRDPAVHRAVLRDAAAALASAGLTVVGVAPSPLRGADGNIELFVRCRPAGTPGAVPLPAGALDAAVDEAHGRPS